MFYAKTARIQFFSSRDAYKGYKPIGSRYVVELAKVEQKMYLPKCLKHLDLKVPLYGDNNESCVPLRDEKILLLISQCHDLNSITLSGFALTSVGMKMLIEKTTLRKIKLRLWDKLPSLESLDEILATSVGIKESIHTLDIYARPIPTLNKLLKCIGQWKQLKVLVLDCEFSENAFELMIPGLLHLELLRLRGSSVTSKVVSLSGEHLKMITFLELEDGSFEAGSLKSLWHHPSLTTLSILGHRPMVH